MTVSFQISFYALILLQVHDINVVKLSHWTYIFDAKWWYLRFLNELIHHGVTRLISIYVSSLNVLCRKVGSYFLIHDLKFSTFSDNLFDVSHFINPNHSLKYEPCYSHKSYYGLRTSIKLCKLCTNFAQCNVEHIVETISNHVCFKFTSSRSRNITSHRHQWMVLVLTM